MLFHPAITFRTITIGITSGAILFNLWSIYNVTWFWLLLVIAIIISLSLKLAPRQLLILAILAGMILWWRALYLPVPPQPQIFTHTQTFIATIVEAPRAGDKVVRYVVQSENFKAGKIQLAARPFPSFNFGEVIRVECKNMAEVNFASLRLKSIYRECAFPKIFFVNQGRWSVKRELLKWRDQASDIVKSNLAEPYASLLTGMLWGDDAAIPQSVSQSFRRTGTSHILAVSGFNVMILTEALFYLLLGIGLWRKSASFVVLGLVGLFVIFTGAEPAVVRAGIMGSLIQIGRLVDRKSDSWNVLLGAGAGMLIIDPRLALDLGFQLSFAAMIGLSIVSPKVQEVFDKLPDFINVKEILIQTLSATAITLPIILVRLDQVSLVSVVTNLLIGPAVPVAFVGGLVVMVLASFPVVGGLAIWSLTLLLAYIINMVEWLGNLPLALVSGSWVVWAVVVILYAGTGWRLYLYKPKRF